MIVLGINQSCVLLLPQVENYVDLSQVRTM